MDHRATNLLIAGLRKWVLAATAVRQRRGDARQGPRRRRNRYRDNAVRGIEAVMMIPRDAMAKRETRDIFVTVTATSLSSLRALRKNEGRAVVCNPATQCGNRYSALRNYPAKPHRSPVVEDIR